MKSHTPPAAGEMKYHAEVTECESLADTVQAIYKAAGSLRVVACLAGEPLRLFMSITQLVLL